MNNYTDTFIGNGRYPRAIRELRAAVGLVRPGFVPGALVSYKARGVLIEPDPMTVGGRGRPAKPQLPRWL